MIMSTDTAKNLDIITGLSHEFGANDYVKGGGGNTSVKDATTLWVKPSGTTLAGMTPDSFVAMDREKIGALYEADTPALPTDREELVKNLMAAAVTNEAGRPSVEAPLHNVFDATYVVHTHPCAVNGMTCARDGARACAELFPDALWVEYIDPGYTLCMDVRERIEAYRTVHGKEPALLVLKNHGIFVAANSAGEIRALYARVMDGLQQVYQRAGATAALEIGPGPSRKDTEENISACFGEDAACLAPSGLFGYPAGPISPDHLVYSRAFAFTGALTPATAADYRAERGYAPKVVVTGDGVYGLGTSQKNADLALELLKDGAQLEQLAEAFGGIQYMSDAAREFIENWEVEAYRQKQV
jgi:rhamnose utilization protein RhaD (predicted bifunctional aldolase and dehydrogenase)